MFKHVLIAETKILRNSIELVIPSNIAGHLKAEHIISGYLTDLNEK